MHAGTAERILYWGGGGGVTSKRWRPYLVLGSGEILCRPWYANVFEPHTAIGSELFFFLTCLHTTTFLLLSIFSLWGWFPIRG